MQLKAETDQINKPNEEWQINMIDKTNSACMIAKTYTQRLIE